MRTTGRCLVWFVFVAALCAGFGHADEVEELTARVQWDGRQYKSDRLPDRLPAPARRAVLEWTPWAALRGYRLDLTDDARVLLISPRKAKGIQSRMRLCEKTLTSFDAFAPAPERGKSVQLRLGSLDPVTPASQRKAPARPSARRLDRETIVMVHVSSQREFDALYEELAERFPALAESLTIPDDARTGISVLDPLVGAWDEEWSDQVSDADNELVHRLSLLLLQRRFGFQPHWVRRGFAWRMEQNLLGDIECFRDEDLLARVRRLEARLRARCERHLDQGAEDRLPRERGRVRLLRPRFLATGRACQRAGSRGLRTHELPVRRASRDPLSLLRGPARVSR